MSVERRTQRPGAGGQGGMGPWGRGGMGMPVQKAKNFRGTLTRLLGYFMPQKYRLLVVLVAAVIGTVFNIVGPKILGLATTKLFEGLLLRFRGVPGATVDFDYIRNILLFLLGLYIISALFQYMQQYVMAGVAQKKVYTLRKQVEEKFERLPLKFYDGRPHGEILSRAVNDMDNISSTLQQSLTQLITSVVTIIGVVVIMLTIAAFLIGANIKVKFKASKYDSTSQSFSSVPMGNAAPSVHC
jgi:ATP-binding cassette, subfamily B, multidrug efflux pump